MIWWASVVESGNGLSVPVSSTTVTCPGNDGVDAGTIDLSTSTASRSAMVVMSAVAVSLAVVALSVPVTPTSLLRVSSSVSCSVAVSTVNGIVACARGAIEPVNVTVNPVTVHPVGGPGRVSGVVVVCGGPGPVPRRCR